MLEHWHHYTIFASASHVGGVSSCDYNAHCFMIFQRARDSTNKQTQKRNVASFAIVLRLLLVKTTAPSLPKKGS